MTLDYNMMVEYTNHECDDHHHHHHNKHDYGG